jgi:glycosyltransferase involved in cell wall biosynthesis
MRLGVINHHGRNPAGSEFSLLCYLSYLPPEIEPQMFLFEEGPFADLCRERYPTVVLPMSDRMAQSTRRSFGLGAIGDAAKLTYRLSRALKAGHIEGVLTNSVKAHFVGLPAARMNGLPCVVYLHDVLRGSVGSTLRLLAGMCGDSALACSQLAADTLGRKNSTIVYSPIDCEQFLHLPERVEARRRIGIPEDGLPVVGLVGRIAPWKGQDRFLRIAARTLRRQKAHFAIIGSAIFGCDPAYPGELRALAERLGIAGLVHFIPWQTDLPSTYAALDVSCNCSEAEPFGRTTVEAMAASLPVICFADAGVCEVYTDQRSGYQIAPYNEEAFADGLSRLLADASLRARLGAEARAEANQIQASSLAPRFVNAIATAMRRSGS